MTPLLVSIPEAAKLTGVSETTAKRLVLAGTWPSVKIGTRRLVVYLRLVQWIDERAGTA